MIRRFLRRFDWLLFGAMLALIAVGTVTIYSAGHARAAAFLPAPMASMTVAAPVTASPAA